MVEFPYYALGVMGLFLLLELVFFVVGLVVLLSSKEVKKWRWLGVTLLVAGAIGLVVPATLIFLGVGGGPGLLLFVVLPALLQLSCLLVGSLLFVKSEHTREGISTPR